MTTPFHIPRRTVFDVGSQRALDAHGRRINEVTKTPMLVGKFIGDTSIVDGEITKLRHGLKRILLGWIVSDMRNALTGGILQRVLIDDSNRKADDFTDLWLSASGFGATIKVRLWVY